MADKKKTKKQDKRKAQIIWTIVIFVLAIGVGVASYFLFMQTPMKYDAAVENIEEGNLKEGFEDLMEIASERAGYKDTDEILYTHAITLIDTGVLESKQEAYKMLMSISSENREKAYKYADDIIYYLWVEDVYDPADEGTFESAKQFVDMIAEDYDGPYKDEINQFRADIYASWQEFQQRKYEAATSDEFPETEYIGE